MWMWPDQKDKRLNLGEVEVILFIQIISKYSKIPFSMISGLILTNSFKKHSIWREINISRYFVGGDLHSKSASSLFLFQILNN